MSICYILVCVYHKYFYISFDQWALFKSLKSNTNSSASYLCEGIILL